MESASKQTFLILLLLLFLPGCVDVDTTNIAPKDYRSQVRFANLAAGVGDVTSIGIDGDSYGSVPFGEAGPYRDIPAGSRSLRVAYSQAPETTYTKIFETDRKGTMFIVGSGSTVEHLFASERYIFEAPGVSDGAFVRTFHASPDAGPLRVSGSAPGSPDYLATGLPYKNATGYAKVAASNYIFMVTSGADTLFKNVTYQFASNKRYTLVVFNIKAALQQKVFIDD